MAEAEEQIKVGGPRPDAVDRDERGMCVVGLLRCKRIEVDAALGDIMRDAFQGADLRRRQAEPPKPVGSAPAERVVMERVESGREAAPDRRRALRRELLTDNDRRETREPR